MYTRVLFTMLMCLVASSIYGEVILCDANNNTLGIVAGGGPKTVFIPSISKFATFNSGSIDSFAGEVYYTSNNCTGTKYFLKYYSEDVIVMHKGGAYYQDSLNSFVITAKSRDNGSSCLDYTIYSPSGYEKTVAQLNPVVLPFSLPIATPLKFNYIDPNTNKKTAVVIPLMSN